VHVEGVALAGDQARGVLATMVDRGLLESEDNGEAMTWWLTDQGRMAALDLIDGEPAPVVGQKGLRLAEIERRLMIAGDTPGVAMRSALTPVNSMACSVSSLPSSFRVRLSRRSFSLVFGRCVRPKGTLRLVLGA
jgi:hypothetical protein